MKINQMYNSKETMVKKIVKMSKTLLNHPQ